MVGRSSIKFLNGEMYTVWYKKCLSIKKKKKKNMKMVRIELVH